jgi:ribosomal protein L9
MNSDRITFAQIQARRHQEAHEREEQAKAWSAEVTEQLDNERSTFLEDFDENEKRLFGLIQHQ